MEQFEKWYKECDYPGDCMSEMAEYTWRAALEWLLTQETSVCQSLPVILTDIIRKELEDDQS